MIKRIINKLGIYKTYPLSIGNRKFRVPVYNGLGFPNFWNAEPWMEEVLKKLGSNDTNFLDVGVNVGQTLLKWKALFPASTYVGFEPNTSCVNYVNDLIEKNQLKHCKIHPYGLSTKAGFAKLYLLGKDKGDASASTIENFRAHEDRHAVPVQLTTLDAVEKTPFDLVKIDVEGAELEVIQSVFETQKSPIIICEILPVYSKENTDRLERQEAINALLLKKEYAIYRIVKQPKLTLKKLEALDIHGDVSLSDYVFIPRQKENSVLSNFN